MDWVAVRLTANDFRGRTGDVVRMPAILARDRILEGRAELALSPANEPAPTPHLYAQGRQTERT
jgi:hypothetical protein